MLMILVGLCSCDPCHRDILPKYGARIIQYCYGFVKKLVPFLRSLLTVASFFFSVTPVYFTLFVSPSSASICSLSKAYSPTCDPCRHSVPWYERTISSKGLFLISISFKVTSLVLYQGVKASVTQIVTVGLGFLVICTSTALRCPLPFAERLTSGFL